jgi:mono/diheme cytochrome c family protein
MNRYKHCPPSVFGGFALAALAAVGTASAEEFRSTEDASVVRGSIVFKTYCILCHGVNGEGDGRASKIHDPKPANLTLSILSDAQKEFIIRNGGASVGRSAVMPAWGEHLTNEQITDVVAYLRKITRQP